MGRFFKIATSDKKIAVNSLFLHETRNENLGDYTGDFGIVGDNFVGEHKQTTTMTFKNIEHYESFIQKTGVNYIADDSLITGCFYKINTPELNKVIRSVHGKGMDCKQDSFKLLVIIVLSLEVVTASKSGLKFQQVKTVSKLS